MTAFTPGSCTASNLDPSKRVNYVTGLVLGADEFCQEQTYFMNRDRVHQWGMHGYGTLLGLDVSVEPDGGTTKVIVRPGRAVDPFGRPICVGSTQCADLGAWVRDNADALDQAVDDEGLAAIYVTLCARECETDQVPVPTGPCASISDSMAPSRIADSFNLSLSLEAPLQVEERAVRMLGEILRMIRVSDEDPGMTRDQFFNHILAIPAQVWTGSAQCGAPPDDQDPVPDALEEIVMSPDEADGLIPDLIDFWVREVRPHVFCKTSCGDPLPDDQCVLIATLELQEGEGGVDADSARVRGSPGPSLLTTRVLQEWLAAGVESILFRNDDAGGDLDGVYPDPTVVGLQGNPVSASAPAASGQVLTWDGATWAPAAPTSEPTGPASGDLAGTYPDPEVAALRGRPVSDTLPDQGQVLTWDGNAWVPDNVSSGDGGGTSGPAGGDLRGTYPNPIVDGLQGRPVLNEDPFDKQGLAWDEENRAWRPGRCFITAAGRFQLGDGRVRDARSYKGDLSIDPNDNAFLLRGPWFNPRFFSYVVKFTFSLSSARGVPVVLRWLDDTRDNGIAFEPALASGAPVRESFVAMVEITAFVIEGRR